MEDDETHTDHVKFQYCWKGYLHYTSSMKINKKCKI